MKNVLIVDDHKIVRFATGLILQQIDREVRITEADSFHDAVQLLRRQPFHLVVLDINVPGGDNLQMIDTVRLRQPDVKILVLSGYDELMYGPRFMEAGADGYVAKHQSEQELKTALQKVLNNEKYFSPAVRQAAQQQQGHTGNLLRLLSNREMEVMQLLIKGKSVAEVSSQLHIQVSTVSTYKQRIMEKLQVSNIIELMEKVRLMGQ